ncbi:sugar phosphate isomerase/epimerase [Actinocrispum sp. NPDC049592]|uniref:sugar phosphate isomerase/epimerase family protein n=1 Tax=Actinocrispum sp. NPDC049592 TaxID=3154835 RepID=UPI00343300FD
MKLAGAPISWGVCEVPGWGLMLDRDQVLSDMHELGLTATELGPPEYLPTDPAELKALLGKYELTLVGGFLATPLHLGTDPEADRTARLLAACGAEVLVLAAATGLDGYDDRPALSDDEWQTLVKTAGEIRDTAAGYGLKTVLHPHVGTHVETQAEVERFLTDSDLQLCLDTGHLMIGGTDPVVLAERYPARIGHLHLKDVRAALADEVRAGRLGYTEAVSRGMYVPLGQGDVDIAAVVGFVRQAGYDGWYVLEQDTALDERSPAGTPRLDTAQSLRYLNQIAGR